MKLSTPTGLQAQSLIESNARMNIWHGAVRSSKTVTSIIRWLEFVAVGPPGPLLMVGRTERTLKRNILDVIVELVGQSNCTYSAGTGEAKIFGRTVYVAGANDARAEGKIRGLTLAGAYGDEITTWPEGMFVVLMQRLSVTGAKFFGTTNPDSPRHWLKTNYLDRAADLDLAAWKFTLDDNPSLSPDYVASVKAEHTGLWYKRFILGDWVMAEGAIWDAFDPDRHVVTDLPDDLTDWHRGIDYGTANAFVALDVKFSPSEERMYVVREWRYSGREQKVQLTDGQYGQRLRDWTDRTEGDGAEPDYTFIDPSAASFRRQMYQDGWGGLTAANNKVIDGIRRVGSLIAADRLHVHESCQATIDEISGYVWDARAQERGEDAPLKVDDHGPDALRYVVQGTRRVWQHWPLTPEAAASIREEAA